MIIIKSGDIFKTKMSLVMITVNCEGPMGRGIALHIRENYPDVYKRYRAICHAGLMDIGKLLIMSSPSAPYKFLMFPSKKEWRFNSKMNYIEDGLSTLRRTYQEKGITELAMPLPGTASGRLNPHDIEGLVFDYLEDLPDLRVELYK